MSNTYAQQLLAQYLSKHAGEELGHETGEAPSMEMLEHAMGGQGEGGGEDSAEALLSQLSPEELEELAASLSGEMQDPAQEAGGEDVEALAQAIQQNLAQNPEASVEGAAPEQAEALDAIKSASYIEGFIKQALHTGLDIKQAVDMYDQALTETVESLQKFSGVKEMKDSAIKGVKDFAKKHLAGPATAAAGMYDSAKSRASDAYGLAKTKAKEVGKHLSTHKKKYIGGAAGAAALAGGGAYAYKNRKNKDEAEEEKTAAYFEGMFEKAAEYGFSESEASQIIKEAYSQKKLIDDSKSWRRKVQPYITSAKNKALNAYDSAKSRASDAYGLAKTKAKEVGKHLSTHKKKYIGGAAGAAALAGGGAYAYKNRKNKDEAEEEKTAAYFEDILEKDARVQLTALQRQARRAADEASRVQPSRLRRLKSYATNKVDEGKKYYTENKKKVIGGAAGAAALAGGGAYAASKMKDKKEGKQKSAEYIEGMYKRALEHGYSPVQAEQLIYNLLN